MRRGRSAGNLAAALWRQVARALVAYGLGRNYLLSVMHLVRRDPARNRICALALPAMAWV